VAPTSALSPPPAHLINEAVRAALEEDLGLAGDITTDALIADEHRSSAMFAAREGGRLAGLALAEAAFRLVDDRLAFEPLARDGARLRQGDIIAKVSGPTAGILKGERVALNFLCHLSGIATATADYVAAVEGTRARIVCTRKTTPGLRAFQKYAVRAGGGHNHRFGLFDAVLIKDNHIAACGGIAPAIERARRMLGHLVKIEVEVDTLEQLDQALAYPIDAVLLDNMSLPELAEAVARAKIAQPSILCEASGGVRLETVRAIAETGVDLISAGSLTHSFRALDIGLDYGGAEAA
jgi:nicotinate-nucleotide pyrophosphorylase (carboxylating)